MLKYANAINKTAEFIVNGEIERAERNFRRLFKHYDDMEDVEKNVMDDHRYRLYGRPFENYSAEAGYWENKILERQERSDY